MVVDTTKIILVWVSNFVVCLTTLPDFLTTNLTEKTSLFQAQPGSAGLHVKQSSRCAMTVRKINRQINVSTLLLYI